jgi:hypothetical protein
MRRSAKATASWVKRWYRILNVAPTSPKPELSIVLSEGSSAPSAVNPARSGIRKKSKLESAIIEWDRFEKCLSHTGVLFLIFGYLPATGRSLAEMRNLHYKGPLVPRLPEVYHREIPVCIEAL